MNLRFMLIAAAAGLLFAQPAAAWDSARFQWLTPIIHPTHSYLTEYAIDRLAATCPDLTAYRGVIVEPTRSYTNCR